MEGLKGTAIRSAVRNPSCPQAPVLPGARRHPAMVRSYSCGWLRPRPPIPARTATSGEPARRVAYSPVTTGWCRDPDLIARVIPPGVRNGFPAPASPPDLADLCAGIMCPAPGRHGSGRQARHLHRGLGALVWASGDCHMPIRYTAAAPSCGKRARRTGRGTCSRSR